MHYFWDNCRTVRDNVRGLSGTPGAPPGNSAGIRRGTVVFLSVFLRVFLRVFFFFFTRTFSVFLRRVRQSEAPGPRTPYTYVAVTHPE